MAYTKQNVLSDELSTFGARLRYEREHQKLSRPALSKLTDGMVSSRVIDHLEKGTTEVTLQRVELLANALDISQDWLIKGESPAADDDIVNEDETIEEDQISEPVEKHVAAFQNILEDIATCRDDGLLHHRRKMPLLIVDAENAAEYLEIDDLNTIAFERGIDAIEAASTEVDVRRSNSFFVTRRQRRENGEDVSEFEKQVTELIDRIIDIVVLGLDLRSVDLDVLTAFAKKHEVSSPHLFGGWEDYSEIVPAVREKYREKALAGQLRTSEALTLAS